MKKQLIALTLCCLTFSTNASPLKTKFIGEEQNIFEIVNLVRMAYREQPNFNNLKNVYATVNFAVTPNYLDRLELSTEDNDMVAIIQYKTKNCDNLKNIKAKLIQENYVRSYEYMDCKNNQFIAKLRKK